MAPKRCFGLLATIATIAAGPAAAQTGGSAPPLPERIVDLTHAFDADTIYWPTARRFELEQVAHGVTEAGYFYAANRFCAAEHGGTHLDAPIHFFAGRHTADEIPLERLIGHGLVIDVSGVDRDHQISVADLAAWEKRNGRIPDGAILLLKTGWGDRWGDAAAYVGTARRGPEAVPELHFPGLHPDAARWLLAQRAPKAIGLDTASIDHGQSTSFGSHVVLFEANVPVFENVANLSALPPRGFVVAALPMKIRGGSGGPLRIVAWW